MTTKILLADDHDLVREALSAYLENEGDAQVKTVDSLQTALQAATDTGPYDLVLLDYNMPGMNGLDGLERFQDQEPGAIVAILSGNAPAKVAQEAIDKGASGFLPKTMGAKSLVNAVQFMVSGETYFPASLLNEREMNQNSAFAGQLSMRESQVLQSLCRGLLNKEIARELGLQEVTIKLHVRTLCRKIEAKNRTHAAMLAKENGFC